MKEETLFTEAIEIADPADRAAFLDRACAGDAELRGRLDRLLARHAQAGNFLDDPAGAALTGAFGDPSALTAGPSTSTHTIGNLIGPYKLIETIGEGGMGVVWLAQQERPVKRLVALKVIKAG